MELLAPDSFRVCCVPGRGRVELRERGTFPNFGDLEDPVDTCGPTPREHVAFRRPLPLEHLECFESVLGCLGPRSGLDHSLDAL